MENCQAVRIVKLDECDLLLSDMGFTIRDYCLIWDLPFTIYHLPLGIKNSRNMLCNCGVDNDKLA